MTGTALAEIYCVGGAALGLWFHVRFPPRSVETLGRATAAIVAAFALAAAGPALLDLFIAKGGRAGAFVALIALVLPTFTAIFWSAGCLLRALVARFGGGA